MENPFSIAFGMEPIQYIDRVSKTDEIINNFDERSPSNRAYMIMGVRGSGKTVLLSYLSDHYSQKENWIVVNVSPETDIINKIAAKLYSVTELRKLFIKARLDLSVFGLGVSIENGNQIFDIEVALERMLLEMDKCGKRVLIAVDEVVNNENVKVFASTFQLLIRQKLPVYLLMTGLYENINNLQNEKTLTFLYRAPKIILEPLSLNAIVRSYSKVFDTDEDIAVYMAQLTKGYPFGYQVLGYLCWKKFNKKISKEKVNEIIPEYDDYLENYVYEKIWAELSEKERSITAILSEEDSVKISVVREKLGLSSGSMSVYRDRLNKKGVVDISTYGRLALKLPRFGEIIRLWTDEV